MVQQSFTNEGNNNNIREVNSCARHRHTHKSTWLSLLLKMIVICNTIIIHFNIWYHKSWFSFTRHSTVDTDREKQNGLKWKETLLLYNFEYGFHHLLKAMLSTGLRSELYLCTWNSLRFLFTTFYISCIAKFMLSKRMAINWLTTYTTRKTYYI